MKVSWRRFQLSRLVDLMKEYITPNWRCLPAQSMHRWMPALVETRTEIHRCPPGVLLFAVQAEVVLGAGAQAAEGLVPHRVVDSFFCHGSRVYFIKCSVEL